MKDEIHPKYEEITVTCGCGNSFKTRSTKGKISVEICSNCHPFYTGKQKFVDTAGMVEKFQRRWQGEAAKKARAAATKPVKAAPKIVNPGRIQKTIAAQLPAPEPAPAPEKPAEPAPAPKAPAEPSSPDAKT